MKSSKAENANNQYTWTKRAIATFLTFPSLLFAAASNGSTELTTLGFAVCAIISCPIAITMTLYISPSELDPNWMRRKKPQN